MSANEIRLIRRKMCTNLGLKIDYNNIFVQGLKRGVGIYTEDMPEIYNQTVQTLAQNGELGFCISDRTLGLGINMPFRSACLLGYKDSRVFNKNDYQQFIGRAGRRGLDREGHVVYCNVDWKTLMKGSLGDVVGKDIVLYKYPVLERISNYRQQDIARVYSNFVNPACSADPSRIESQFFQDFEDNVAQWRLKYFPTAHTFLSNMDYLEMKFNKQTVVQEDICMLLRICMWVFIDGQVFTRSFEAMILRDDTRTIFNNIKQHQIHTNSAIDTVMSLCYTLSILHNEYRSVRFYEGIVRLFRHTFTFLKNVLNKENCLNTKRRT